VNAANTLGAGVLGSDPHEAGGRRVIFLEALARTFPDPDEQAIVGRPDRLGFGAGT
jgi:hypothetical protein